MLSARFLAGMASVWPRACAAHETGPGVPCRAGVPCAERGSPEQNAGALCRAVVPQRWRSKACAWGFRTGRAGRGHVALEQRTLASLRACPGCTSTFTPECAGCRVHTPSLYVFLMLRRSETISVLLGNSHRKWIWGKRQYSLLESRIPTAESRFPTADHLIYSASSLSPIRGCPADSASR